MCVYMSKSIPDVHRELTCVCVSETGTCIIYCIHTCGEILTSSQSRMHTAVERL